MTKFFGSTKMKNNTAKVVTGSKNLFLSISQGIILLGIIFVILSPIIGIVSDAIRDEIDSFNPMVFLIPHNFTTENFELAFIHMNYLRSLALTAGTAFGAMILQVLVCSFTGYGFARFRFPGRGVLFAIVIVTIIVPVQSYMVSLFAQFRFFGAFGIEFNLLNTFAPVLMMSALGVGIRSGLFIYIFRQFFKGLPKEIEEAALIDGAGWLRTYVKVMLPNASAAIITVSVFAFVWQYNDTFYASMFMHQFNLLPVRLLGLPGLLTTGVSIGANTLVTLVVSAGVLLVIAPVIVLYLGIQRMFMEGVERSGIVG